MTYKDYIPYSPYNLRVKYKNDFDCQLESLSKDHCIVDIMLVDSFKSDYTSIQPYLHPLSDIVNEIIIEGYPLIPAEELLYLQSIKHNFISATIEEVIVKKGLVKGKCLQLIISASLNNIFEPFVFLLGEHTPKWIADKLYEWHFDMNDYIKNGEAIELKDTIENEHTY